jgi:chromosome segregation ATPase
VESLLETEVVTLSAQKAELEKHIQKLMAMLQHSDNARQDRESAGKDPRESQFRHFYQQLWDLEQRNGDLQSAANFFDLNPSQNRSLQFKDIEASINQIQSELESVLGNCDSTNFQLHTAIEHGSDLEALLLSSLNLHKTPQDLESRLKEWISEFEAPVIVRTLVLAALQDWVFNTSFPPFTTEGTTSLFLKSIEDIAMSHG